MYKNIVLDITSNINTPVKLVFDIRYPIPYIRYRNGPFCSNKSLKIIFPLNNPLPIVKKALASHQSFKGYSGDDFDAIKSIIKDTIKQNKIIFLFFILSP